jgi:glycosyltransferase involved in cell wall biosynthesis
VERETAAAGRLRLLVVVPSPPRLDARDGGARAIGGLVARLAARHSVALVAVKADDELGVDDVLRKACSAVEEIPIRSSGSIWSRVLTRFRIRVALVRGSPTWASVRMAPTLGPRLQELANSFRPDILQLEYRITGAVLPLPGWTTPTVVVEHDPAGPEDAQSWLRTRLERRAWRSLGRSTFSVADAVVVFTERDRREIAELSGATSVVRIPLGCELPHPAADPVGADPPRILFVGSFVHAPNIDAAVWLAEEIIPAVTARFPSAWLQIVGSSPPAEVNALVRRGVAVIGDVPSISPYLDDAAVVAAPIRQGGGMRVKVIEALAAGKAVVATPLALEGLDVRHGEHVLVAETAAEFADAVVALLADAGRRAELAMAARRWAEDHLDPDTQVRAYERLYASLLAS